VRERLAQPRSKCPLGRQYPVGNDDPLFHPPPSHRDEGRGAGKREKLFDVRHAETEDHLVPQEATEHVAVHEDGRVAEHLPPLDAAQRSDGLVERSHERRWRWCLHCSTTQSARSSTERGMVTPIVFAVLTLIASSNFVGCSTGRSAGFAPFRILST